jgi:hypothetical protein
MPGSPTLISGYTSQLQQNAVMCDRDRILSGLNRSSVCCPPPKSTSSAQPFSSLLLQKQNACNPDITNILSYPKKAITMNAYTLSLQNNIINASNSDPSQRFSQYVRFFPTPCPPPLVTNAGIPHAQVMCSPGSTLPPTRFIT